MVTELLHEILREITAKPVTIAIEVVQFFALLFIVKAVAFGLGKRKGVLTNMLAERRARVERELTEADDAHKELALAKKRARAILREARAQAKAIRETAHAAGEDEKAAVLAASQQEAAELIRQAEEILAKERADALGGMHDQLVDLVGVATRQILNEGFTPAEQRQLIQKAVLEGLEDLESVAL